MSLLIIRCPIRPVFSGPIIENIFDTQKEVFEWCLCDTNTLHASIHSSGLGSIESMPYAEQVLVLMPTIDVRLIEKKVPLVKAKKLQQVLPNLVEDDLIGGIGDLIIYALPPISGHEGSHRTVAIINRAWFNWLSKELSNILASNIRLIPECLILPLNNSNLDSIKPRTSCIAYQKYGSAIIYTWHKAEQLGIAWADTSEKAILPSALKDIEPVEWSWDWATAQALLFSRRTDFAALSINLLLANSNTHKRSKKSFLSWLTRPESAPKKINRHSITDLDKTQWDKLIQLTYFAMGSVIISAGIYTTWLAIDNWRWGRNIEVSAAQFLAPDTIRMLAKNSDSDSITHALTKQLTNEARYKGLPTDADFAPMAIKLQQLASALSVESIHKIEYYENHIDFEFKSSEAVITPSLVLNTAQNLGLKVINLNDKKYRLQPYSGLESGNIKTIY